MFVSYLVGAPLGTAALYCAIDERAQFKSSFIGAGLGAVMGVALVYGGYWVAIGWSAPIGLGMMALGAFAPGLGASVGGLLSADVGDGLTLRPWLRPGPERSADGGLALAGTF
jgi:hypothetical protein